MDGTSKLKIKIGDHEFEAEGPAETVQAQFNVFKELIGHIPERKPVLAKDSEPIESPGDEAQSPSVARNNGQLRLDTIMKTDGRVVSLTARANSLDDAILLVLLGQKTFRSIDGVTGSEIIDGLKVSGQPTERIDRVVKKLSDDGYVIITGVNRGKRYRLTNQGLSKAQEIARAVIATVA
jgi:hypothetical protein